MGKQWAQYPEMSGMTDGKPVGCNGSKRAQNTKQKEESIVLCHVVLCCVVSCVRIETAGEYQGDTKMLNQKKKKENPTFEINK